MEEVNGSEILEPTISRQVALGVCSSFNSCDLEPFRIRQVIHETSSGGRGYKAKEG